MAGMKWAVMAPADKEVAFRGYLNKLRPAISQLLPANKSADRMVRVLYNSVKKNPRLLSCDRDSLLLAVMKSAELGLEPDTVLQQCFLIPYGNKVQLQIGYRGLLKLARESKGVAFIEVHPVFEGEDFVLEYGIQTVCRHTPSLTRELKDMPKLFYAVVRFTGSQEPLVEWMTNDEVMAIRDRAPSKNSPAWKDYYTQMGRKVLLKRTCNYIPQSDRLAAAIEADNKTEAGAEITLDAEYSELLNEAIPPERREDESATDALAEKIGAKAETTDDGQSTLSPAEKG